MTHVVQRFSALLVGLIFACCVEPGPGQDVRRPAQLQLTAVGPGYSLLELESEVAEKLERIIQAQPIVAAFETEIRDGECRITITLKPDVSVENALSELEIMIVAFNVDLKPEDIALERTYFERDSVWIVLKPSKLEQKTTIEIADAFQSKLAKMTGVGKVAAIGTPRPVIDITVDTAKSRAYSLSAAGIYQAIRTHVVKDASSTTQAPDALRDRDSLTELSQRLSDLVLKKADGNPTRLMDVARVQAAIVYQSEAWLDRDRVIAFDVRSKHDDRDNLLSNIENNQTDWNKALDSTGKGARFVVFKPELKVELMLPADATDAQFDRIAEMASTRIRKQLKPTVDLLSVRTGPGSNVLQLYLQRSKSDEPSLLSSQAVRESLGSIPGVLVYITDLRNDTDDSIELRILGPDLDVLRKAAQQAAAQIRKIDGVEELRTDSHLGKPDVTIEIQRKRAAQLGIKMNDITTSIDLMMRPDGPANLLNSGVRLRFPEVNAESLAEMRIPAGDQQTVPLSTIVDIQLRQTPLVIRRRNGSRMAKLTVQPASQDERQRIEREVRTIGENVKPRVAGEVYRIEVE